MHAPAKTPQAIINTLNAAIVKALAVPAVRQNLASQGIEAREGTPEQFAQFVRAEVQKMVRIVKASGARPE